MMCKLNNQKGFTLVELLIVIAIIGVLAMVAVPRFMNMIGNSQTRSCQANQGTLETALEQLVATGGTYAAASPIGQTALVTAGFLKREVFCPTNPPPANAQTAVSGDYDNDASGRVFCGVTAGHN